MWNLFLNIRLAIRRAYCISSRNKNGDAEPLKNSVGSSLECVVCHGLCKPYFGDYFYHRFCALGNGRGSGYGT